jgi:hypothetical protein
VTLPAAVLELAAWTQHHPYCARAETTALRCTCGLDEAWQAIEELLEPPLPMTSNDQRRPR